jgi:hypothetical protein
MNILIHPTLFNCSNGSESQSGQQSFYNALKVLWHNQPALSSNLSMERS